MLSAFRRGQTPATARACVVTGASSGIGYEIALGLARRGARVIGVGRDTKRCAEAAARIREEHCPGTVHYEVADLSRQSDVRALSDRLAATVRSIDVLVNNAATFSVARRMTVDGVELQFAVNYLAGFLLTALLSCRLANRARVITVSSGSHFSGRIHWSNLALLPLYNGLTAYGQSKLANVLFSYELARRAAGQTHIGSYAVDPGLVNTQIGLKGTGPIVRTLWRMRMRGGVPASAAAAPIVDLALSTEPPPPSGLYWREGRPVASSKRSYSRADAQRLWSLSEELCGEAPWWYAGTPAR